MPAPLHSEEDIQGLCRLYEDRDNVKMRALAAIYSAVSRWSGVKAQGGHIPVVRNGSVVNTLPDATFQNALAPQPPLPEQVVDAAFTQGATELRRERAGLVRLIASLERARKDLQALVPGGKWVFDATWDKVDDWMPDKVVGVVHALGLTDVLHASAHGVIFNARQRIRYLDLALAELPTGSGRPRDAAAHLVGARYGRLYSVVTGKVPTFGESPDGLAGEFTPALRDLFDALGWHRKSLRGPAASARAAVTDAEIRRAENNVRTHPPAGILSLLTGLPDE